MASVGSSGTGGVLPALKTSIDGLNRSDLRSVIPQIIRSTTGVRPQYGNSSQKPKWWPYDLPYRNPHDDFRDPSSRKKPWNDVLRDIIKNCYQYYGQEHLLSGVDVAHGSAPIKVVNNQDGSVSFITQSAVVTLEDRQNTPYAACPPTMEAATPGRSLSASTGTPEPLPTGLFMSSQESASGSSSRSKPAQTVTESKPFVEVFMCFFCEKEFRHKQALQQHQNYCSMWPAHFSRTTSTIRTRSKPEQIHVVPRKPRKLIEDKVTFPPKSAYVESLDLLPQAKAESVRRESHSRVIDCDVIVLDESKPPKTPTTPRTPKSLISQLSRDLSPPVRVRLKVNEDDETADSIDDTSDDDSESGKSESEGHYRPRRAATLLNIDISSLLGERVRKHISTYFANLEQYQSSPDACSKDYENFCRTPTKSKVTERLRSRGKDTFQVTFRKTKRTAPAHCHKYKFRHSERAEFCRIVETGLSRRSRALKRQVKKCKVVLDRLPESVIKKWTRNRRGPSVRKYSQFNIGGTGFNLLPLSTQSSVSAQQLKTILSLPEVARDQLLAQLAQGVSLEVVCQRMLSGFGQPVLSSSPADLTPPSTPEELTNAADDDVICLDDSGPWGATSPSSDLVPIHGKTSSRVQHKRRLSTEHQIRNAMLDISNEDPHLDDDVISISSTESAELLIVSPESLKRKSQWSPSSSDLPSKRRRVDQLRPSALLFKCHLCSEELTCQENANHYIKDHFAKSHNVYNIDLIEHFDPGGQKVVSIVEVPTPEKHPQSSFYLSTGPSSATQVNMYQNQNVGSDTATVKHKPAILQNRKSSKTASPSLPASTKHTSASAVLTAKQTKSNTSKPTAQKLSKPTSTAASDKQKSVARTDKPGPSSSKKRPEIKIALQKTLTSSKATRSNSRKNAKK